MASKPYKFIGFGAMEVTKPYKFIGFGAMEVTKPYEFIGFGAVDVTKVDNIKVHRVIGGWGLDLCSRHDSRLRLPNVFETPHSHSSC